MPTGILVIFVGAVLAAVIFDLEVVRNLRDQAFARGLITLLICISTIGIAFLLVYQAFYAADSDDRFRRGREVFTGLMGVLGTIVGFYFGTAEKPGAKMELTNMQKIGTQLVGYVSNGAGPYTYMLTFSDKTPQIKDQPAKDGWIIQTIPQGATGSVTLMVTDSKEQKASKSFDLSAEPAAAANTATDKLQQGTPPAARPPTPQDQNMGTAGH